MPIDLDRPPVDRGSGVSLWRQIAERIECEITTGAYPPGSLLPSESELTERFGVNRHTVRRSLAVLAEKGLVRSVKGRGSFVEEAPLPYPIGRRVRFSENVMAAGRAPRGRLLGVATVVDAEPTRRLGLPARTPLLRIEMVSSANGVPLSRSTSWFEAARFAGLEAELQRTGSVSRAFAAHGIADYARLETAISARLADPAEQELLELPTGRVVLVVEALNADADGRPIQVQRTRFAADRVHLVVNS
ncbi:phosphonate metabolism transcriptional regulator PhnF [Blastochloris tepida]|uniref:phosphonate metabolism transcriptional regulator PhnF n=1 Tax=Blastochloris tepida TaxID=2233851 RepID=UPI001FCE97F6|nr:phosphonate metabolism transcriptional regulator PhnF [Blastochloris tepida]